MKLIFAIVLIIVSPGFSVQAQSIERSVISSFGFSYSGATIATDNTLGETIIFTGESEFYKLTQGFQQPSAALVACFGDFDLNGVVNTSDLLIFMGEFGCSVSCGVVDVNDDGAVNTTDLLLFMGAFGTVCN